MHLLLILISGRNRNEQKKKLRVYEQSYSTKQRTIEKNAEQL